MRFSSVSSENAVRPLFQLQYWITRAQMPLMVRNSSRSAISAPKQRAKRAAISFVAATV